MPFFGTTPFAAPGLGAVASAIMLAFGLWWLGRAAKTARRDGEGFGHSDSAPSGQFASDENLRARAAMAHEFDVAEVAHGEASGTPPPMILAALPLLVVIGVNLAMSLFVLPRLNTDFLAEPRWGPTSLSAVAGVWSVVTALACGIATALALNHRRIPLLRATIDAGANASVLPAVSVASLVGFGAAVAAMPAFAAVRDAVLGIGGGPLVSMTVAINVLAGLTGSASGGLTIALDTLGPTYMARAAQIGLDPGLLHRVAVIGSGTLDTLPHNGAIVTLLTICGVTHRESYRDIIFAGIVGPVVALAAVITLGSYFGSF
jgi:H+/gluconate symporter-like permease